SVDGYDHVCSWSVVRCPLSVAIQKSNGDGQRTTNQYHHSASICTQPYGPTSIWARPSANDNTSVRLPRKSLIQAAVDGRKAAKVVCVSRPSVSNSRTRMPLAGSASGSTWVHKMFLAPTCTN